MKGQGMRKSALFKRVIAMVLAAAMLVAIQPQIISFDLSRTTALSFKKSDRIPDSLKASHKADVVEPKTYGDDETVRVTIVLEESSTVEAGYDIDTIATDPGAIAYRDVLEAQQRAVAQRIEAEVLGGKELDVVWNLTLAANAISAYVEYGYIEDIKEIEGVADVFVEAQSKPAVVDDTAFSGDMIGWNAYDEHEYSGAGQIIAVIDTGIDDTHQSFDEGAFEYSINELNEKRIDEGEFEIDLWELKYNFNINARYHFANYISADSIEEYEEYTYLSGKIPFAFNYANPLGATNHLTDTQGNHGSVVAGVAAGNKYIPNPETDDEDQQYIKALDEVSAQGIAPDAQLMVMKVFGATESGAAYISDTMAALEDAVLLGADVINMSFGSDGGFTTPDSDYYQTVLDSLVESGVIVSVAAGNSGSWGEGNAFGYTYADDVNMQTLSSPASYSNSLSVASVKNVGSTGGPYPMSSFSSWGVTGTLELKPEITAPGENIYSVNGSTNTEGGRTQYTNKSGTSLAASHISGMAALISQYVEEQELDDKTYLDKRTLIQSLLMSTAVPLKDDSGNYYSVFYQGAGLANVGNVLSAESFIQMDEDATILPTSAQDGKVKAELGDDPDKTGIYEYTFTITNFSDEEDVLYELNTELFTQAIKTVSKGYGTADVLDTRTTPISAEVDYFSSNIDEYDGKYYLTLDSDDWADVTVEITVNTDELTDYVNGAYIEGYTFLTPVNEEDEPTADQVEHSIPILGFYGNWSDPSMYDDDSDCNLQAYGEAQPYYFAEKGGNYTDYSSGLVYTDPVTKQKTLYIVNPYGYKLEESYEAAAERAAVNSSVLLDRLQYVQIRNGYAGLIATIDGEEILLQDLVQSPAPRYVGNNTVNVPKIAAIGASLNDFTASDPEELEEDELTVQFTAIAIPEYYYYRFLEDYGEFYEDEPIYDQLDSYGILDELGKGVLYETPLLTVDNTAPELILPEQSAEGDLILTMQDNRYIGYVGVFGKNSEKLYYEQIPENQIPGEECTVTVDAEKLAEAGRTVLVVIADYAGNLSSYEVELVREEHDYTSELFGVIDIAGYSEWYIIDTDNVPGSLEKNYEIVDQDIIAAAYADGYVFQATEDALYISSIEELGEISKFADLEFTAVDMAVNYSDKYIYALDDKNGIWAIDPYSGKSEYKYTMPGFASFTAISADVDRDGDTDYDDAQAILDYNSGKISGEGLDLEAGDLDGNGLTTTYDAHLLLLGLKNSLNVAEWTLQGLAIDPEGNFYGAGYHETDDQTYLYLFNWTEEDVQEITDKDGKEVTYVLVKKDSGMDISSEYATGVLAYDYGNDLIYMAGNAAADNRNMLYVIDTENGRCVPVKEDAYLHGSFSSLFVVPDDEELSLGLKTEGGFVTGIEVNPSKLSILAGYDEVNVEATVYPLNLEDRSVTWKSGDENIATVDENGNIRGIAAGKTVITATTNAVDKNGEQLVATVEVTVEEIDVALTGLVSNVDGLDYYWGLFIPGNTPSPNKFGDALDNYVAGTLNTTGEIIYITYESELHYKYPDNYNFIGPGCDMSMDFFDAAPAPMATYIVTEENHSEFDNVALLCGSTIYILDPRYANVTEPPYYNLFGYVDLTEYVNPPAQPVAIDYIGYKDNADYFYVMLENGDLYVFCYGVYTDDYGWGLIGKTGIDLTGTGENPAKANASLVYDSENSTEELDRLYLSYTSQSDATAKLAVIDVNWNEKTPVITVPVEAMDIDESGNTYSMVSLYIDGRDDLSVDLNAELTREFDLETFHSDYEIESGEEALSDIALLAGDDGNVDLDEQLKNTLYINEKDGVKIDTEKNEVSITVTAKDATNALYTIAYGEELTLTDVKDNGEKDNTWSSYKTSEDNSVTLDFASSLEEGYSGEASTFLFTYEEEAEENLDTSVTMSYIQLAEENGTPDEPIGKTEIPIEIEEEPDPDDNEYKVSVTISGGSTSSPVPPSIKKGEELSFTIKPNEGYKLPDSITVTIGGTVIAATEYTYDPNVNGFVLIPAEKITGDVNIVVNCVEDKGDNNDPTEFKVNVNISGGGTSTAPKSIEKGKPLEFTLKPDQGYKLPNFITVTIGGKKLVVDTDYLYDPYTTGSVSIPAEKITGDVKIDVKFVEDKGDSTSSSSSSTSEPVSSSSSSSSSTSATGSTSASGTTSSTTEASQATTPNASESGSSGTNATTPDASGSNTTGTTPPDNTATQPSTPSGTSEPETTPSDSSTTSPTDVRVSINVGAHGSTNAPATIKQGEALSFTITPDDGYRLPDSITVMIGGRVLDKAEYVYDNTTGYVSIGGSKIAGDVQITVDFVSEGPDVSPDPDGSTNTKPDVSPNPDTGVAIALVPVLLTAEMLVLLAKRKKK